MGTLKKQEKFVQIRGFRRILPQAYIWYLEVSCLAYRRIKFWA